MTDDAGQPVKILNPAGFAEWPIRGDDRIHRLMIRINLAFQSSDKWIYLCITILSIIAYIVIAITLQNTFTFLPPWSWWLIACMFFALTVRLMRQVWQRSSGERIVETILQEGLCASCGYNLVGSAVRGESLVVCPECSAAWSTDRIERMEAFTLGSTMSNPLRHLGPGSSTTGWSVPDARGQIAMVASPGLRIPKTFKQRNPEKFAELEHALVPIRRELARANLWTRVPWLIITWFIAIALTFAWWYLLRKGHGVFNPGLFGAGMFTFFAYYITYHGPVGYRVRIVAEVLTRHARCPGCARKLEEMPLEQDGCRVCMHCRSAWRLKSDQQRLSMPTPAASAAGQTPASVSSLPS